MKSLSIFIVMVLLGSVVSLNAFAGNEEGKPAKAATVSTNAAAPAASARLSGTVVDQLTGETLVGAAVSVEGSDKVAYTNLDGKYEITGLTPGCYSLKVTLISYDKELVQNLNIQPNGSEVLNIRMKNLK